MENKKTINLNGKRLQVDMSLNAFSILEKESRSVQFFGVDLASQRLFVQYTGGKCYVYNEVPVERLESIQTADSVGVFINAMIVGKYEFVKIEVPLILTIN